MYSLAFLVAVSFLLCLAATPVVRGWALRHGLVDRPDGRRKTHRTPVPRVGGAAIAFSYMAAYACLLATPSSGGSILERHLPLVWQLMPAAALAFATGLLDDLVGLRPWEKLAGQAAAAGLAWAGGVQILAVGGRAVPEWCSLPITVIWLLGCANAFNLIDGMDGLAAGLGLVATTTTLVAALVAGDKTLALATAPLVGCLLGFLCFNFNPASIFLGDCGSLLVGFLLGCYAVLWSQKSATLVGMTAPLMALAIPLTDVALAVARRFLNGQPIFHADRGHIHHRLLDRGLTPRRAVLVLYAVAGVAATFSLLSSMARESYGGLVTILFCGAAWLGIQQLGYAEFSIMQRLLFDGALRRTITAHIRLNRVECALAAAGTAQECWSVVREACSSFGYGRVTARLGGGEFDTEAGRPAGGVCWQLHVPLEDGDFLRLWRALDRGQPPPIVSHFVESLRPLLVAHGRRLRAAAPAAFSDSIRQLGTVIDRVEIVQPAGDAASVVQV